MIYLCIQCYYKATNIDNLTKNQSEHLEEDHLFQKCHKQLTHEDSLIEIRNHYIKAYNIITNNVTIKHLGKTALPSNMA